MSRRQRTLNDYPRNGDWFVFCLFLGRVLCVLALLAIPILTFIQLDRLDRIERGLTSLPASQFDSAAGIAVAQSVKEARVITVVAGIVLFCLSAAFLMVFGRIRYVALLAEDHFAENARLWQAVRELQERHGIAPEKSN